MRTLCALLLATQAGAACPDPGAMATGISILSQGHRATYRAGPGGVTATITASDGWSTVTQTLLHGLLAVEIVADFADPAIPDQHTLLTLPPDLGLPPAPGRTLALSGRVIDQLTGQSDGAVLTLTAGQSGRIRIGDCLLDALPVTILHDRTGASYRSEMVFLPDYGFAYLARRQFREFAEETFAPTGIVAE